MKEYDRLWLMIIFITLANALQYVVIMQNIFASYLTIMPLLTGYSVYLISDLNKKIEKVRNE